MKKSIIYTSIMALICLLAFSGLAAAEKSKEAQTIWYQLIISAVFGFVSAIPLITIRSIDALQIYLAVIDLGG